MKRYREMAAEVDDLIGTDREMDGLTPIEGRVSKSPRAVLSFRVTPAELEVISKAAQEADLNISDYIRKASLSAASKPEVLQVGERAETIAEVKAKLAELAETASRL